jgi:hypothetical protein
MRFKRNANCPVCRKDVTLKELSIINEESNAINKLHEQEKYKPLLFDFCVKMDNINNEINNDDRISKPYKVQTFISEFTDRIRLDNYILTDELEENISYMYAQYKSYLNGNNRQQIFIETEDMSSDLDTLLLIIQSKIERDLVVKVKTKDEQQIDIARDRIIKMREKIKEIDEKTKTCMSILQNALQFTPEIYVIKERIDKTRIFINDLKILDGLMIMYFNNLNEDLYHLRDFLNSAIRVFKISSIYEIRGVNTLFYKRERFEHDLNFMDVLFQKNLTFLQAEFLKYENYCKLDNASVLSARRKVSVRRKKT